MGTITRYDPVSASFSLYAHLLLRSTDMLSLSDLLAHLPSAAPPSLIVPSTSRRSSPERQVPKTPVTVTSSFDDDWETSRKALEAAKGGSASGVPVQEDEDKMAGKSGAGLSSGGSLGVKVDVSGRGMKGRKRRGVGPGVTYVIIPISVFEVS
jgi:hypothetical protein